jgi:hypothetical protein
MWTCKKCGEQIEDQFDSCWKCTASQEQTTKLPQPLGRSFFFRLAVAAVLSPMLADALHTLFVSLKGIRLYQAAYWWYLDGMETICFFVGVRAIITFLVLRFFAQAGFRGMTIWCCTVFAWLLMNFWLAPALVK